MNRNPINVVKAITGTGMLATGDDGGVVKVLSLVSMCAHLRQIWDLRQRKAVFAFEEHDDFISDITVVPHKKTVLAAGYYMAVQILRD